MDLPGRPGGDPDALRAGARAWDHLAWEVWHLSRPVERHLSALLEGWSGPAADAYRARWEQVHRGLGELDHRLHTNADHLRVLAGLVEDAQSAYDHALAAAGIATVAGIGLTLVTGGASDALAVEADSALGATVTAMIAEFQFAMGRMMALVADLAELMGALASRFAIEFAIKGPDLAYGAVGGAATGIAFSLADGERNLRDLALSGVVGGLVEGGRLGRKRGGADADGVEGADVARRAPGMPPPEQVEQAWRASLSPAHAAKQEEFDSAAAFHGTDADYASIKDALTARTTRAIEAQSHGSVRYIDRGVVNRDSVHLDALTDIDIETDSAAIQVKSGGTRELSTQMIKTSTVTGKKVIGFAPEMTDARFSWYRSRGYLIVRNLDDLLRALRDE